MKKVIIAIHGLGNKPEAALLEDGWLKAIHEGLDLAGKSRRKVPFNMVYWADISHPEPLDPAVDDPESPRFLKEPYAPSPPGRAPAKPRRFRPYVLRWIERNMDRLFLKKNMAETFPGASAKMMERYFSELDTYYTDECRSLRDEDCSAKAAIQARARAVFAEYAGHEILLLSHSMGSIIAFDALWPPDSGVAVHTFVTLGSPLGLPPIVARNAQAQRAVFPELTKPKAPDGVWPLWYNLSDRRDTVALDHTLRDDYAANRRGLKAVDLFVENDYEIDGHANPHKSYGYLRTPEVAGIIDAFLSDRRTDRLSRNYRRIKELVHRKLRGRGAETPS